MKKQYTQAEVKSIIKALENNIKVAAKNRKYYKAQLNKAIAKYTKSIEGDKDWVFKLRAHLKEFKAKLKPE